MVFFRVYYKLASIQLKIEIQKLYISYNNQKFINK